MRVGNAVILKDDAILDLLEEPTDARRDSGTTSKILIKESRLHVTMPVNICGGLPGQAAFLNVLGVIGSGAIGRHEDLDGFDLS